MPGNDARWSILRSTRLAKIMSRVATLRSSRIDVKVHTNRWRRALERISEQHEERCAIARSLASQQELFLTPWAFPEKGGRYSRRKRRFVQYRMWRNARRCRRIRVREDDDGSIDTATVSYTHLRAHETGRNLVCRLLLEKKKK